MEEHPQSKFLRLKDVKDITGLSRSTIYDRVKDGSFPKPIKLGEKSSAWLEHEVRGWML